MQDLTPERLAQVQTAGVLGHWAATTRSGSCWVLQLWASSVWPHAEPLHRLMQPADAASAGLSRGCAQYPTLCLAACTGTRA